MNDAQKQLLMVALRRMDAERNDNVLSLMGARDEAARAATDYRARMVKYLDAGEGLVDVPLSQVITQVSVAENRNMPGVWRVEAIDEDGAVEMADFFGPCAEERACAYAKVFYGEPVTIIPSARRVKSPSEGLTQENA